MMFDTLDIFLERKTLYYDKIEYDTISKAWNILKNNIKLPYVIHIVGTNGKGTTGRYIASFLTQLGDTVLHYTSPHINKINERIWINGYDSSDDELNQAHFKLQKILPNNLIDKLTYFEYMTLLGLLLSDGLDYIVLEAGLGGEFDATNVVKNDLTVVPSIGMDHIEFLGNTIEKIATTKLKSCDKRYIINCEDEDVLKLKKTILKDKDEILVDVNKISDCFNLLKVDNLPSYLQSNLILALKVTYYLKQDFDINSLKLVSLRGRYEKISNNITIDVGHNVLAAQAIINDIKNKNIILIYNTFKDKDYKSILKIFKPIIKELQIIDCDDKRMINKDDLIKYCKELKIKVLDFNMDNLREDEQYLVFGSFKVVEEFVKEYKIKNF